MKKAPWKTSPISPTCEVMRVREFCGRPTAFAYPAMGGGWMPLCEEHAAKHHPHCSPLGELLAKGETLTASTPSPAAP